MLSYEPLYSALHALFSSVLICLALLFSCPVVYGKLVGVRRGPTWFALDDLVRTREEVFMEGPLEPNMGPSLADVLLCTFYSTNTGFSSFPVRKLLS
jgi:hypothetical protein